MFDEKYDFDLTKFIQAQQKKGNNIVFCGFDARGAWEGCTGIIRFADGIIISIADQVCVYDKDNNDIEWQEV